MNKQLCIVFMKECGIAPNGRVNELSDNEIEKLSSIIKCWKIRIKNSRSFDYAQVTAGGAECSQFDSNTMESKLVSGLYFAGEVLDLDALTGGFNLQIAWTTGHAAGSSIFENKAD